jgi:O-antigen/teichoic acid export membrane protein
VWRRPPLAPETMALMTTGASTPEGRHDAHRRRRDRALIRTLGAGAGLQIATVAGALLSLPFVTRSLTSAEYGVLATVTGFVVLVGFADLGVGSALTKRLAEASGRDDRAPLDSLMSSAIAALCAASALVLAIGTVVTFLVPWQRLLGAPAIPEMTLRACILTLVACTVLTIVGSLGKSALYGIQRGSAANHWLVAATLVGAGTSIAVAVLHGPLWLYVFTAVGSPALVSILSTWWALRFTELRVRPRRAAVRRAELISLAGTGGWFFAITLAGVLGYQTDSVVVAAILGASSAGVYSVALRVFGLVTQTLYPAMLQLWPAFTEALGRGDAEWVRSRFWRSTILAGAAATVLSVGLVLAGPTLIAWWLTPELTPSTPLLVAFAGWTAYTILLAPLFFLLNAIGRVRAHAWMAVTTALANIPLSIALTHAIGITGPVYASLAASFLFAGVPAVVVVRHVFVGSELPRPAAAQAATPQDVAVPASDTLHVHEP